MEHYNYHIITTLVLSLVSWETLFRFTTRFLSNRSFVFCNRIISIIHASLAVTLASLSVQDWTCPFCPLASKASPLQTMVISLGYMVHDLVCCLYYEEIKGSDVLHHLVTCIGLGTGLLYQMCGSELVGALWVSEISGPFDDLRVILKELGYRDTNLNLAVDICFAVIFSIARMIGSTYLMYLTVSAHNNPILIKAMSVGLQTVSTFWFYRLVRFWTFKFSNITKSKT
ncbi:PREDICTED: transmembrane protein 136-like isoform X2 [Ipomoea nil]|uniref:transmembrane protein 136-like isoform X2 n=1 Tax=Ipomoea nil TaxID=35883 RepID=UPI000900ECC2|nr:PREDICTED: transmembrane protein 136-like isoform X2 [Ipomoea nil]